MSVINKMLRDLDSRQAAGTIPFQTRESRTGIASGTLIANDADGTGRKRGFLHPGVVMLATVLVLGAAAGAWWYLNQNELLQQKVDQLQVAPTPAMGKAVMSRATGIEPVIVARSAPATVDPANVPLDAAKLTPSVAAKLPLPVTVPQSGAAPADISLKMDSTFKGGPSHATPAKPAAAGTPRVAPERSLTERPLNERAVTVAPTIPAAAMAVPQSPQRRSPALEALAQAQNLWSSGSREAGINLLREALVAAERTSLAGTSSGNNSVLASLARELARMELAEGRVSQALEMLRRLEPLLSGFADVWAMRGNAAQRLGHHEESAAAYLMALKLRPNEARWMLGAAVSLAAQGQTASAAELAEKARVGGVLSPEVATYLRQLGVPLRER